MADVKLSDEVKQIASNLGEKIASSGSKLVFGFEGDFDSLSVIAARSAEASGGETIAFIWGDKKIDTINLNSTRIVTGQFRGGGREFSLILSCDAVICVGGGSGTLMEIAMAYQAGIPIAVINETGGWSDRLANTYLDDRKRLLINSFTDPKEGVKFVLESLESSQKDE